MNENQRRMIMTYFVTEQWLKDQLENQADLVIVDVRSQLNDAESGKKAYTENHIQHAVYLDLKDDLSGEIKEHGGSHPLPETEKIVKTLGNIGVDEQTTVIFPRVLDRKSTRLNSSHVAISYAVFCLKKKSKPTKS